MSTGFVGESVFVGMAMNESTRVSPANMTILFGVCISICSLLSTFIIEKYTRRAIINVSCVLMIIVHLATAAIYMVPELKNHTYFTEILFVLLTTLCSLFCLLLYPVELALRGEVLPQSVRSFGCALMITVSSISAFITCKLFLSIVVNYGAEYNFLMYAVTCAILLIFTHFYFVETKGKTLEEIQNELNDCL